MLIRKECDGTPTPVDIGIVSGLQQFRMGTVSRKMECDIDQFAEVPVWMLLAEVVPVPVRGSDGTGRSDAVAGDGGRAGIDDKDNGDGLSGVECFIFFRIGESLKVLMVPPVAPGDTMGGGVTNSISPKTKSTMCEARSAAAGSIGLWFSMLSLLLLSLQPYNDRFLLPLLLLLLLLFGDSGGGS